MLAREIFSIVRTYGTFGLRSCWMLKKTGLLTRPLRRAKTRRSADKTAVSEEARRTLRYIEPLSAARTPLADFFRIRLGFFLAC